MSLALVTLGGVFIILLFAGAPLVVVLGLSSVSYILMAGFPITVLAQRMFTGIDVFLLLAIPLFALAGEVMNSTALTNRLVTFAQALVGRVRGGLAAVNVVSSMLFSGITGSAAADTSAIGSLMIPTMVKSGYSAEFSAAVTAVSSIIGPIIPPSIVFIMYGMLANVSVVELFVAGIVPGLIMGLSHLLTAVLVSTVRRYETGTPTSFSRICRTGKGALPALTVPIIIIGGIIFGIFTPTEAGAVAVFYAVIAGGVLNRGVDMPGLVRSGTTIAFQLADILLIIAASNVLAWILTIERIPLLVAGYMTEITSDPILILILVNAILLIVGMFLDTFPAMIILTPILLPIVKSVGMDPVHFGVVMSLNLMIGAVTPPVGILLYIACRIGNSDIVGTLKEAVPFIIASILVLALICFVPELTMYPVSLFRGG